MNEELVCLRRLIKFSRFLKQLPEKKFDIRSEVSKFRGEPGTLTPQKALTCGMAACALGWAPVCFPTLLKYDEYNTVVPTPRSEIEVFASGEDLMALFFGITMEEAEDIYMPSSYAVSHGVSATKVTPKMVAQKIDLLVYNKKQRLKWKRKNA